MDDERKKVTPLTVKQMMDEFDLTKEELLGAIAEVDEEEPVIEELDYQQFRSDQYYGHEYYCKHCLKFQHINKQSICRYCGMKNALKKVDKI